ncbi:DinI-like family protein [Aliivibrio fischeri]|uniref:DinI-like family protein n=1 Tax=Aliivibrio fischeri TaxID=668 RepID=UPI00084C6C71|nr:DinI-like family protein [Aliivibrio fischeri]OED53562.1 damage-inducible protein DinI [Aliivibrio fischeri]
MRIEMIVNVSLLPKNGIDLLNQELEKQLLLPYPDAKIRIRKGQSNSLEVYAKKEDKKNALKIIETLFNEADSWLYQ